VILGRAFDATGSYASLLILLAAALAVAAATTFCFQAIQIRSLRFTDPRTRLRSVVVGENSMGQHHRNSRCQFSRCEVVLRRNAECVCDAIEESEQGCDVYSFGNLSFFPSCKAQLLNIVGGGSVSSPGN
jgi:hypothetical protein